MKIRLIPYLSKFRIVPGKERTNTLFLTVFTIIFIKHILYRIDPFHKISRYPAIKALIKENNNLTIEGYEGIIWEELPKTEQNALIEALVNKGIFVIDFLPMAQLGVVSAYRHTLLFYLLFPWWFLQIYLRW